ncbi:MAG TPA: Ig-like domain-containing protein [Actinomycetota bacterium]
MYRSIVRFAVAVFAASLLLGAMSVEAFAEPTAPNPHKPPAVTTMRFKLDAHQVAVGEAVTGSVRLFQHHGHTWTPVADASLSVRLDGTEVGTATTDADGRANVSATADTAGDHVVKVVYAGDDSHKRCWRAQGFEAGEASSEG